MAEDMGVPAGKIRDNIFGQNEIKLNKEGIGLYDLLKK